jgi:hypothetical protein
LQPNTNFEKVNPEPFHETADKEMGISPTCPVKGLWIIVEFYYVILRHPVALHILN